MESSAARQANRAAVLWALLQAGTATRVELAAQSGLSAATVSRVVDGLIADGLAREAAALPTGRPGRRVSPVEIVAEAGTVVGVDLGGSNCRVVAVDLLGNVRRRLRAPTPTHLSARRLASWIASCVQGVGGDALAAVSIGVPGVVDPGTGEIRNAPNLAQVEGKAFSDAVAGALALPVAFENDSNLALLGEMRLGAARERRSAVMFTIGTGLGAGVVLENRLLRGRTGFVGEFGYLRVGTVSLESTLSARGLLDAAAAAGVEIDSPAPLFSAHPPRALREIRRRFEEGLALAIFAVTTAYEPEVVVIGGGVAESLHGVVVDIEQRLEECFPEPPVVAVSTIGDAAGAVGAVISGLRAAYARMGVDEILLDASVGPGLASLAETPEERVDGVS